MPPIAATDPQIARYLSDFDATENWDRKFGALTAEPCARQTTTHPGQGPLNPLGCRFDSYAAHCWTTQNNRRDDGLASVNPLCFACPRKRCIGLFGRAAHRVRRDKTKRGAQLHRSPADPARPSVSTPQPEAVRNPSDPIQGCFKACQVPSYTCLSVPLRQPVRLVQRTLHLGL